MLHTYHLSVPHAAAAETIALVLRTRPPFMVQVLRAPPPPLLNDGRAAIPMRPRPTAALNARTGPLLERNFAIAGGLDGAFTMIHVRVDADAVDGNALVSLCNRYRATEGWIPRTNIHRSRRQEVRTTSARDESKRRSPRSATR